MNAACSTQGSKISCACKPGYEGDGRICVPKNPCTKNNGECPLNSTYCVFEGPNKVCNLAGNLVGKKQQSLMTCLLTARPLPLRLSQSSCKCNVGMVPVGGRAELGCELVSACTANTCHSSAQCHTERSGQARCGRKVFMPHK